MLSVRQRINYPLLRGSRHQLLIEVCSVALPGAPTRHLGFHARRCSVLVGPSFIHPGASGLSDSQAHRYAPRLERPTLMVGRTLFDTHQGVQNFDGNSKDTHVNFGKIRTFSHQIVSFSEPEIRKSAKSAKICKTCGLSVTLSARRISVAPTSEFLFSTSGAHGNQKRGNFRGQNNCERTSRKFIQ